MTTVDPDGPELVLRAIRAILRRISEHSKALARDHGVTLPQLLVLRAIFRLASDEGGATIGGVSKRVALSPATTSRVVDRLEKAGLVRRQRRKTDRRKVFIVLTDQGEERYAALPRPLQESFRQRLEALDDAEQQRLVDALESIVTMMDADVDDAAPVLHPEDQLN